MALMRFNPVFGELPVTRERFNRIFGGDDLWNAEGVAHAGDWAPAVDIVENDAAITIKAELPGVEAKDIAVTVENNVLTMKGERHLEKEAKKENYHRMERSYGVFTRAFVLPANVDGANIKGVFKDGLLTLTLAKNEGHRTRKIEVKVA